MKNSGLRQRKSRPPSGAPEVLSPLLFWIVVAGAVAIVLAAYSPSLQFHFILDDNRFVQDPRIQFPGHVWEYFTNWVWAQFAGGPASFYRPLFLLWMRANFVLSGMAPWGWHFLSVLKHMAVAVLLGVLAWRLLRDRTAAWIAGALFAIHPAHTESVAWVTVPDPLMAAGVLASILLYLRYRDFPYPHQRSPGDQPKRSRSKSENVRPSIGWLVAASILYLAALLAKETAIVTLGVLLVVALMSDRLIDIFRKMSLFVAATLVYLLLRQHALGIWLSASTRHLPWRTVLLSLPATLWFYLKVLVWPIRSYAFGDPTETHGFSLRTVLLPGLAVGCAVALLGFGLFWAFRTARRDLTAQEAAGVHCSLVLGALLLILPLLPALNLNALNPEDYLHGRYAYLSTAGLMLLLATGWHLASSLRRPLLIGAASVAIAFLALTVSQETAWNDDLSVFAEGQRNAPHNVFVGRNLTRAHVQQALGWGRCQDAVPVFEDAVRRYPDDWVGWAGLGDCLDQLNDLPRAEQALHRAADLAHLPQVTARWREVSEKCSAGCQPPADWQSAPR